MSTTRIPDISVCGGNLALDFINTVREWLPEQGEEYLGDYNDFIAWSKRLKVLSPADQKRFNDFLRSDHHDQEKTIDHIRQVRRSMYLVFSELANTNAVSENFSALSRHLEMANKHTIYITDKSGKVSKGYDFSKPEIAPLWNVLNTAAVLLLDHDQWARVRACPACGWLFHDTSKGGKRKWCVMSLCGSREKASRYYYNQKSA